jgi:hypothetical protein
MRMADSDRVDQFFHELDQRGHEPLLDRMDAVGRIELHDGGTVERWLVSVRGGYVTVSKGDGEADVDWVMRADRRAFERVIHGDAGSLAAVIRGTLSVQMVNPRVRFGLITRLFAGPPESRKQWTEDQALNEQAPAPDREPAR